MAVSCTGGLTISTAFTELPFCFSNDAKSFRNMQLHALLPCDVRLNPANRYKAEAREDGLQDRHRRRIASLEG